VTPRPLRRHRDPRDRAAVDMEVVVARYAEEVNWTRKLPPGVRVTIYDKRGDLSAARFPYAQVIALPNVGLEAHSYLEHILARGDRPADVTLFCQGHPFDHAHDLHAVAREVAAGAPLADGFRWLGHIVDTDDCRGRRLFTRWSKNRDQRELAVDRFHEELLGEPCPPLVHFRPGAQFAVAAARLRSRPRAFWERARELALAFPDAGHCFERLWDRVFGVRAVDPASLGPDGCLYLKPIRRLQKT